MRQFLAATLVLMLFGAPMAYLIGRAERPREPSPMETVSAAPISIAAIRPGTVTPLLSPGAPGEDTLAEIQAMAPRVKLQTPSATRGDDAAITAILNLSKDKQGTASLPEGYAVQQPTTLAPTAGGDIAAAPTALPESATDASARGGLIAIAADANAQTAGASEAAAGDSGLIPTAPAPGDVGPETVPAAYDITAGTAGEEDFRTIVDLNRVGATGRNDPAGQPMTVIHVGGGMAGPGLIEIRAARP